MDELRSWFEVPAIAHYFHIFRGSFDLIDFEIEDFEETLFLDSAENVSSFLPDLLIRLLRGLYKTKDGLQVTLENYNQYLRDLLHYHYVVIGKKENPVANVEFKALSTRTKIAVLFDMCNWRLELHDAMELTKDLEADDMRVEPVGRDDDGNSYWYFYGSRLYKEGFSVKPEECNNDSERASSVEEETKKSRRKKRTKKRTRTKRGRAVRKKRRLAYSSQESDNESEKSVEIPDEDTEDSNQSRLDMKPLKLNLSVSAWSLACSTMEEWNALVEKHKEAKTKNEKQLVKNLRQMTETIAEIFEKREQAMQRKLLAMAPRRVSDRITIKMQQKGAEERLLEQERLLKSQQKAKEAEERQKQLENEKEKEREKRYKEREKIQEERARRAKLREEQKLVADNPGLMKELKMEPHKKGVKNENESEEEEEEEEDSIYAIMDRVLEVLIDHDDAWPFLEPVDEEEAPNYYTFIKNPIDFQTVSEKIKKMEYKDKNEFEADIFLIFDNCETYNGTFSSYSKLAFKLKKLFNKLMKREFPPDVENDDDDFFEVEESTPKTKKLKKQASPQNVTPRENVMPLNTLTPKPDRLKTVGIKGHMSGITPELARAQMLQAQARMKQLHQSANLLQPASVHATNILPTRFGIPAEALSKLSPAQMQALLLRYPRAGFAPSLVQQGKLPGQQFILSQRIGNLSNSAATTTLNPLQQLANTALAPSNDTPPILKISPPQFSTPNMLLKNIKPGAGQILTQTPRLIRMPGMRTTTPHFQEMSGGVRGRPKKMVVAASHATPVRPAGSYASSIPVSGVPVAVKWEDLKNHLVTQMKTDVVPVTTNKENSLKALNTSLARSFVPTPAASTVISPGMPGLRPVSFPTVIMQQGVLNTVTTTTPTSNMFSFSNVFKAKEMLSTVRPVTITSPTANAALPAAKVLSVNASSTLSTNSTLSNVTTLSSHSKVSDWLHSSRNYIGKPGEQVSLSKGTVVNIETPGTSNKTPPSTNMPVLIGSSASIRFVGYPSTNPSNKSPVVMLPSNHVRTAIPYRPVVTLPSACVTTAAVPVTITSPQVRPVSTAVTASLNQSNSSNQNQSASVSNSINLLELQKAALQAAAINQISSKLQTHLKHDQSQAGTVPPSLIAGSVTTPIKITSNAGNASASTLILRPSQIKAPMSPSRLILTPPNSGTTWNKPTNGLQPNQSVAAPLFFTQAVPKILNQSQVPRIGTQVSGIVTQAPGIVKVPNGESNVGSTSSLSNVSLVRQIKLQSSTLQQLNSPSSVSTPTSTSSQTVTIQKVDQPIIFDPTQLTASKVATKPHVVSQAPLHVAGMMVPDVSSVSPIVSAQTIRFFPLSNAAVGAGKQVNLQQRLSNQGQTVRYVIPGGQSHILSHSLGNGSAIHLNQLGASQNVLVNNVPIASSNLPSSVQIVANNVPNDSAGMAPTQNILATGTQISSIQQAVVPQPIVKNVIFQNVLNNSPLRQVVPHNAVHQMNQKIVRQPVSSTVGQRFLSSQLGTAQQTSFVPTNSATQQNSSPRKVSMPSPTKTILQISPRRNGAAATIRQNGGLSKSDLIKSTNLQQTNNTAHTHCVVDQAQLQKLKEQGRIAMTPSGQLFMIAPTVAANLSASTFK